MKKIFCGILLLLFWAKSFSCFAQSDKIFFIEQADRQRFISQDTTSLLILAGHAQVRQGKTLLSADSIVINQNRNILESFTNVAIHEDSVAIHAQYLQYIGNDKKAFLKNNVTLSDGKALLSTNNLEYQVNSKIGIYRSGGTITSDKTIIKSTEGIYYGNTKDVHFIKNVSMTSPDVRMKTDSLLHNTETKITTFIAPTTIYNETRIIKTKVGFYNSSTRYAHLKSDPTLEDSTYTFTANEAIIDDSTGFNTYWGNAQYRSKDTAGYNLLGDVIKTNKKASELLAYTNPVLIAKSKADTMFLTADTLFVGKLSTLSKTQSISNLRLLQKAAIDSKTNTTLQLDTLAKPLDTDTTDSNKKIVLQKNIIDTTIIKGTTDNGEDHDNYFVAYHHVRVYSTSMRAVCDSLFYSAEDSTLRFITRPILWANGSQITGDTMYLFIENKRPEELYVFANALSLERKTERFFNQVRGNGINAYFTNGAVQKVRAKGNAEAVYYGEDSKHKFIAVNKTACDIINLFFDTVKSSERTLQKILFLNNVSGNVYPMLQADHEGLRLRGFKWLGDTQPKSKLEILAPFQLDWSLPIPYDIQPSTEVAQPVKMENKKTMGNGF